LDLESILAEEKFDAALFGDVLEHMRDPLTMLRRTRAWVVPEGFAVASLPNIAHGAVRLALLQGRFDYRPEGLLDDTHLRFFTHDSIKELFREAGFAVVETRRTHLGLFDTEIPIRAEDFPPDLLRQVEEEPEATTYQFVVKALVDNAFTAAVEAHEREEEQRRELVRLTEEVERLADETGALQAALAEAEEGRRQSELTLNALRDELEALRVQSAAKDDALAHHEAHWQAFEQRSIVKLLRRLKRITGGG